MEIETRIKKKHELIGCLVHNHTRIEHAVAVYITNLGFEDEIIGLIFTSEMSFKNLMSAFSSLVKYKSKNGELIKEHEDVLNNLISKINTLEQKRNIYAHSMLFHFDYNHDDEDYENSEETYLRIKMTAKQNKGFKLSIEEIKTETIQSIITEQESILNEMKDLQVKLMLMRKFDMNKLKEM